MSALVHGYARRLDLAHISNAFHLHLARLRTTVHFEWVPSNANIADLPSREGDHAGWIESEQTRLAIGGTRIPLVVPDAASFAGPLSNWVHAADP